MQTQILAMQWSTMGEMATEYQKLHWLFSFILKWTKHRNDADFVTKLCKSLQKWDEKHGSILAGKVIFLPWKYCSLDVLLIYWSLRIHGDKGCSGTGGAIGRQGNFFSVLILWLVVAYSPNIQKHWVSGSMATKVIPAVTAAKNPPVTNSDVETGNNTGLPPVATLPPLPLWQRVAAVKAKAAVAAVLEMERDPQQVPKKGELQCLYVKSYLHCHRILASR